MLACRFFLDISKRVHLRERSGCSTTTKHSEGQNEDHDLSTTVQRRGDDVVVLDEELGALPPQVVLGEEA